MSRVTVTPQPQSQLASSGRAGGAAPRSAVPASARIAPRPAAAAAPYGSASAGGGDDDGSGERELTNAEVMAIRDALQRDMLLLNKLVRDKEEMTRVFSSLIDSVKFEEQSVLSQSQAASAAGGGARTRSRSPTKSAKVLIAELNRITGPDTSIAAALDSADAKFGHSKLLKQKFETGLGALNVKISRLEEHIADCANRLGLQADDLQRLVSELQQSPSSTTATAAALADPSAEAKSHMLLPAATPPPATSGGRTTTTSTSSTTAVSSSVSSSLQLQQSSSSSSSTYDITRSPEKVAGGLPGVFGREAKRLDHALGVERANSATNATNLNRANERIAKLLAEVLDTTTALQSAQSRIRSLESAQTRTTSQRTAEVAEYERRLAALSAERDSIEKQTAAQSEQSHVVELTAKQRLIDSHRAELDAARNRELEALKQNEKANHERIREREADQKTAERDRAAALKAAADVHAQELSTVRAELDASNKTIKELRAVEQELDDAHQTITERDAAIVQLSAREQAANKRRDEYERSIAALRTDLSLKETQHATTTAQLSALERARDKSEQTYRDMVTVWNEEKQNRERMAIADNQRRQSEVDHLKSAYQSQIAKGEAARKMDDEQHRKVQTELLTELHKYRDALERERVETVGKLDACARERAEIEHTLKQHQIESAARETELVQELSEVKGLRLAEQKEKELKEKDERESRERAIAAHATLSAQLATSERERIEADTRAKVLLQETVTKLSAAKQSEVDQLRSEMDVKEKRAAAALSDLKTKSGEREETLKRDVETGKRKLEASKLSMREEHERETDRLKRAATERELEVDGWKRDRLATETRLAAELERAKRDFVDREQSHTEERKRAIAQSAAELESAKKEAAAELARTVRDHTAEMERVRREHSDALKRVDTAQKEAEAEIDDLNAERTEREHHWNDELERAGTERARAEKELIERHVEAVRGLDKRYDELKRASAAEAETLRQEKAAAERKFVLSTEEIEANRKRYAEQKIAFDKSMDALTSEKFTVEKNYVEWIDKLKAELKSTEKLAADETEKVRRLTTDAQRASAEFAQLKADKQAREEELNDDLDRAAREADAKHAALTAEANALKAEIERRTRDAERAAAESVGREQMLTAEVERWRTDRNTVEALRVKQNAEAGSELERFKAAKREAELDAAQRISALDRELDAKRRELQSAEKTVDSVRAELKIANEQHAKSQERAAQVEVDRRNELDAAARQHQDTKDWYTSQLTAKEKKIQDITADRERVIAELAKGYDERVRVLQAAAEAEKRREVARADKQRDEIEQQKESLSRQLHATEQEVDRERHERDQTQKVVVQLKAELDAAEHRLTDATAAFDRERKSQATEFEREKAQLKFDSERKVKIDADAADQRAVAAVAAKEREWSDRITEQKVFHRTERDKEFKEWNDRMAAAREELKREIEREQKAKERITRERDEALKALAAADSEKEESVHRSGEDQKRRVEAESKVDGLRTDALRWRDQFEVSRADWQKREKQMLTDQISELEKKNSAIRELSKQVATAAREKDEYARTLKDMKEKLQTVTKQRSQFVELLQQKDGLMSGGSGFGGGSTGLDGYTATGYATASSSSASANGELQLRLQKALTKIDQLNAQLTAAADEKAAFTSRAGGASNADLLFAAQTKDSQLAVLREDAIRASRNVSALEQRLATSEAAGTELRRELEVIRRKNREQRAELRTAASPAGRSPTKLRTDVLSEDVRSLQRRLDEQMAVIDRITAERESEQRQFQVHLNDLSSKLALAQTLRRSVDSAYDTVTHKQLFAAVAAAVSPTKAVTGSTNGVSTTSGLLTSPGYSARASVNTGSAFTPNSSAQYVTSTISAAPPSPSTAALAKPLFTSSVTTSTPAPVSYRDSKHSTGSGAAVVPTSPLSGPASAPGAAGSASHPHWRERQQRRERTSRKPTTGATTTTTTLTSSVTPAAPRSTALTAGAGASTTSDAERERERERRRRERERERERAARSSTVTTVTTTAATPSGAVTVSGAASESDSAAAAAATERKYRRALEKERERDANAAVAALGTEQHFEQLINTANTNAGFTESF